MKESPPRDLQSRYRSELALLDRRKDQRRQQQTDKRAIQTIPKIASYLKALKPFLRPVSKAPRPITPIGGHSSSSFTVSLGNRAFPPWPDPDPSVRKGLSVIKGLEKKKEETGVLIGQSIEKMAQMEVEAISRGVELPPRQRPDDVAGDPKMAGREKTSQAPPEQAFLSDPEHEHGKISSNDQAEERRGREPSASVNKRKEVVSRHIQRKSDWQNRQKREALVKDLKTSGIPTPRYADGTERFPTLSWDDILLSSSRAKLDLAIKRIDRWRWVRKKPSTTTE